MQFGYAGIKNLLSSTQFLFASDEGQRPQKWGVSMIPINTWPGFLKNSMKTEEFNW